jgi:hypothetical protein
VRVLTSFEARRGGILDVSRRASNFTRGRVLAVEGERIETPHSDPTPHAADATTGANRAGTPKFPPRCGEPALHPGRTNRRRRHQARCPSRAVAHLLGGATSALLALGQARHVHSSPVLAHRRVRRRHHGHRSRLHRSSRAGERAAPLRGVRSCGDCRIGQHVKGRGDAAVSGRSASLLPSPFRRGGPRRRRARRGRSRSRRRRRSSRRARPGPASRVRP